MNKKALAIKFLIGLILFAVITLLVAFPILSKMFGFFISVPETGSKKSLDALTIEINNIGRDKPRTVPVYVDEDHFIKGYTTEENKPMVKGCEEDQSCLCLCSLRDTCTFQDKKMQCKRLEFEIKDPFLINTKLDEGDPTVQNCELIRDNTGVSISCS
jgi:hypothetical protein|tara:strand:- start:1345 stop:1818 length:474 start_codon:yes stop_codon:yes gene_type:complete